MTTPSRLPFSMLTPGATFRQYTLLEQIGVGGQGVVWSGLDQDKSRIYAIKFNEILDTDEAEADDIRAEYQLEKLVRLHHAHTLAFHEYGFKDGLRFTVSPYIPGGTLAHKIKAASVSIKDALRYGMEIASALDFLHSRGVIHRDIKSSNILLDFNDHTYLADFGLARVVSTSTVAFHTGHGTPPYAPPEQNRLKEITPKSDIYSFGILLFEMFTGQLPWNGKKQLGMEQLHSKQEIPDPRELNRELPPRMVDVLRRVTAAEPELRLRSAGEVMRAICYIFDIPYNPQATEKEYNDLAARKKDVDELLWQGLTQWKATDGTYNLGLTRFALIDLNRGNVNAEMFGSFLLSQALTYGYKDSDWWSMVSDPRERLSVSSILLRRENETIAARIIEHLTNDMEIQAFSDGVPEPITTALLEIGVKTTNVNFRRQIFHGLRELMKPDGAWNEGTLSLNPVLARQLGGIALEDTDAGDAAAVLIGHLRSIPAVQVITDHQDEERKIAALLLIQETAGSLPTYVQGRVRFRLRLEWAVQRLIQQPVRLASAYVLAFLAASLGVGIQVYLTFNLPDFFDAGRITVSLERGLIVGAVFGLGIFMTRVLVERFHTSRVFPRIVFGTIVGGLGMNLGMLVFHVIFLHTPPRGLLITGGCMLIALAFVVGSFSHSYLFRVLLTTVAVLAAIMGTWWVHVNFADSNLSLTPIFRYEYSWSFMRVSLTALWSALPIGILGNMINLSIEE